eukprot:CAMPEP_0115450518 /NCGR_PEP_ID=MMETSP0271-20121206/41583_1 /TAXON_ID=71861 /ORGANISM="Scrippsiella trochoidea, Strain CCMP3099" /LENGTH=266 /DNA_ID=CAMNT_0002876743 /DNA_START=56 /DNA_END=856 /DNA_ORIENTATION=-
MGANGSTEVRKRSVVLEAAADLTAPTPRAANCDKNEIKRLLGSISPVASPVQKASCPSPVDFDSVETALKQGPGSAPRQELGSAVQSVVTSKALDASPRPGLVLAASEVTTPAEDCQPKIQQKPKAGPLLLPIQAVRSRREVAGFTANSSDSGDASARVPSSTRSTDAYGEGPKAEIEERTPKLTRGKSAPSLLLPSQAVRSRRLVAERDSLGGDNATPAVSMDEASMAARTSTISTGTRSTRRSVTFGATQFRDFVVESDGSESD